MKKFLLILGLISLADAPANAFTTELRQIELSIENLGTKVMWSKGHSRCHPGLLGVYAYGPDAILICQDNIGNNYKQLVSTLKHEGWHVAQRKCNHMKAILSDQKISRHLTSSDVAILRKHYPSNQHRLEAEARVIEQVPTAAWLRGMKTYCL